jgi:transposase-like protein
MVGDLKLNGDSRMVELTALERREGERSDPSRSGGAANSRRAAVPPAPDPEVVAKAQRRKFTAEYKLGIVEEADRVTDPGAIGALLRREGLYSSHLVEWRRLRDAGALGALSKKRGRKPTRNPLAEENGKLKAELARVNQKLQQAEIIIDVQKKVSALLGISLPEAAREEGNS